VHSALAGGELCQPIANQHKWQRVSRNIFTHREPKVGWCKLKPVLNASRAGCQLLKLVYDLWLSTYAFSFNLSPCTKSVTEDDVLICTCRPDPETGAGCGDECINRDVLVECDPEFCPCGTGGVSALA
jgi:hypothetical protein